MKEGRYRRYRTSGGLATGIFIIVLAFAIYFSEGFGWRLFVPILFAGWAFVALFVAASSGNPKVFYGGLHSFTWLLSLGILFLPWVSFWPWILIPVGVSFILGALSHPIMTWFDRSGLATNPPPQEQFRPYSSDQQGYRLPPTPPVPGTYQEGGQPYVYPPQLEQQSDQPQAQPPQQKETLLHQQ